MHLKMTLGSITIEWESQSFSMAKWRINSNEELRRIPEFEGLSVVNLDTCLSFEEFNMH